MELHSGPGPACLVPPAGQRPRVELVEPQVAGVERETGAPETPGDESEVARGFGAVPQEAPESLAVELGAQAQEALPGAPGRRRRRPPPGRGPRRRRGDLPGAPAAREVARARPGRRRPGPSNQGAAAACSRLGKRNASCEVLFSWCFLPASRGQAGWRPGRGCAAGGAATDSEKTQTAGSA